MDIEYIGRVLVRLKPFVKDGVIRRTRLERVLAALQVPASSVRPDVERLLAKAGITIDEDSVDPDEALSAVELAAPGSAVDVHDLDLAEQDEATSPRPADLTTVRLDRAVSAARRRLHLDLNTREPAKVLLTAEEEVGLATLVRGEPGEALAAGGYARLSGEARRAAESLFLHNQGLVHSVARRTPPGTLEYDDLFQHGVIGLIRAIELFDPSMGMKFSTYAVYWIRQSIDRGLANESRLIRLPVHMIERVHKVWATRTRLTVNGEPPPVHALALQCELSDEQVSECLRLGPDQIASLDQRVADSETTLGELLDLEADVPSAHDLLVQEMLRETIHSVLDTLPEREAGVISLRFGLTDDEPKTLDEIGKVYGVTRERIRQIEGKTMSKLRHVTRSGVLRPYLFEGAGAPAPNAPLRDGAVDD